MWEIYQIIDGVEIHNGWTNTCLKITGAKNLVHGKSVYQRWVPIAPSNQRNAIRVSKAVA